MLIYVDFGAILELLFAPKSLYFDIFFLITFGASFLMVLHLILELPMSILTAQANEFCNFHFCDFFDFWTIFNLILAVF